MRILIIENNWELATNTVLVDTKLIQQKNQKMLSFGWLFGSCLLTLFIIIYSFIQSVYFALLMTFTGILLWGIFALSYYFISRFPVKSWSANGEINRQYNDLTKYYWSLVMVVLSYVFAPMLMLPMMITEFSPETGYWFSGSAFLITTLGLVFTLYCLFDLRKKQDQLISQSTQQRYTGEDDYWRYAFYYNPDDRRLMLPDRIGLNITMNMARPAAKITAILTGILIIGVMSLMVIPAYNYDFNPQSVNLKVNQTSIVLSAPLVKTSKINFSDIEKIELVDHIPKQTSKVSGLNSDNYLMGSFRANQKAATLYVNLNQQKILHIVTKQEDYYFTGNQNKSTVDYFNEIKGIA